MTLFDKLFSRQVVPLFSKTGVSRTQDVSKEKFDDYVKIKELLFATVELADRNFKEVLFEQCISGRLRNSVRRAKTAPLRKAAPKNRPKNLKYKKKTKDSDAGDLDKEEQANQGTKDQQNK